MADSYVKMPDGREIKYTTHGQDNDAQARIAAANNQAQIYLSEWQNQKNIDFWNMQNDYSSAKSQVERLKDAQLNPSFYGLDGQGAAAQLQAATAPQMQAPNYFENNEWTKITKGLEQATNQMAQAFKMKELDLEGKKLSLQEKQVDQDIKESEEKTRGFKIDNDQKLKINPLIIDNLNNTIKNQKAEWTQMMASTRYTAALERLAKEQGTTEHVMRQLRVDNIVSETAKNYSQIQLNKKEMDLIGEQITNLVMDSKLKDVQISMFGMKCMLSRDEHQINQINIDIMDTDEYKATAKRFGLSDDALLRDYVSIVSSTITGVIGNVEKLATSGATPIKGFGR